MKKYFKYLPFYLLSLLPIGILHALSSFLYFLLFYLLGYRKQVVLDNLHMAFPDKSPKEIKKIRKRFFRHFTDLFIEALKVLSISPAQAAKRVQIKNPELLNTLFDEGKSIIVYAAHTGNWEWMAFLPLHIRHRFVSFYQPQSNSYFNELMLLIRQRFGNRCLESKLGYKTLLSYADQGILTLTYVIGDQRPGPNGSFKYVSFFKQETAFLKGTEHMASRLNQVVLYAYMKQVRRGFYEVEYFHLDQQKDIIQEYASRLEATIRQQPEQWLWSHKRWKALD